MNRFKSISAVLLILFGAQAAVEAREGGRFWQIQNRLRLELDDNVRQEGRDEDDSLKIIEEIEFHANFNLENTFFGLSYTPAFIWWDDRDEDDTDVHHYFNANLNHQFTPRLSVSVRDTFLRAELPELVERGSTLREENDYNQNDLNGDVNFDINPQTRVTVSGRNIYLAYDEDLVAEREDYSLSVAGLTLARQVKPTTQVRGEFRYEMIEYDQADGRDSDSLSLGGAVDHSFSPNFLGALRAGVTQKDFDSAEKGDTDSPYADLTLTVLPSPATRISTGLGYSLFEAGVFPFVNQERLRVFASIAHDVTARISIFLSATFTDGEYDASEIIEGESVERDGNEETLLFSARASYQINRNNSVEVSLQHTDFQSDLAGREDYDRNRLSVGWRTAL